MEKDDVLINKNGDILMKAKKVYVSASGKRKAYWRYDPRTKKEGKKEDLNALVSKRDKLEEKEKKGGDVEHRKEVQSFNMTRKPGSLGEVGDIKDSDIPGLSDMKRIPYVVAFQGRLEPGDLKAQNYLPSKFAKKVLTDMPSHFIMTATHGDKKVEYLVDRKLEEGGLAPYAYNVVRITK
jgi:hypothetical protein